MNYLRIVVRRHIVETDDYGKMDEYIDFIIPIVTIHFIPCSFGDLRPLDLQYSGLDDTKIVENHPVRAHVRGQGSASRAIGGIWEPSGRKVEAVQKGERMSLNILFKKEKIRLVSVDIVPATMFHWCFKITERGPFELGHRKRIIVDDISFGERVVTIIVQVAYEHVDVRNISPPIEQMWFKDKFFIELQVCRRDSKFSANGIFQKLPESFQRQINAHPALTRRRIQEYPRPECAR